MRLLCQWGGDPMNELVSFKRDLGVIPSIFLLCRVRMSRKGSKPDIESTDTLIMDL